ncbi:MAG: DnaJ domain-containing protein [Acidobacteriota bacterium]
MKRSETEIRGPLVQVLRQAFLQRRSGTLELESKTPSENLYLRQGEIHVDRDGDLAVELGPTISKAQALPRPSSDPMVRQAVAALAKRLGEGGDVPCKLRRTSAGAELAGPLPTVCFLLACAADGLDERQLVARLGGEDVSLQGSDDTPAMGQLPGLDPDMAQVLTMMESPLSLGALLRSSSGARLDLIRGVAKLWAVGLVREVRGPSTEAGDEIVTPKAIERFLDRIAESLDQDPLELPADLHRSQFADLFGKLGKLDHYQLLGIEMDADDGQIIGAYNRLARRVHPRHAKALGLGGKEEGLSLLFERATEAYLVLSDPRRRSSYNTLQGLHRGVEVGAEQRDEEKKRLARQSYLRGSDCLSAMEYSMAVELLKEAVRLDPKTEYLSLLARAQSKNPKWQNHAVESYRRALERAPEDAGLRLGIAQVLESLDRLDEARDQYRKAVELMPENPKALEGLERLGGTPPKSKPKRGGLRGVLGRRRSG